MKKEHWFDCTTGGSIRRPVSSRAVRVRKQSRRFSFVFRRHRDAGTKQRLSGGRLRRRWRRQILAGAALRQGHLPRVLHTDRRRHVSTGKFHHPIPSSNVCRPMVSSCWYCFLAKRREKRRHCRETLGIDVHFAWRRGPARTSRVPFTTPPKDFISDVVNKHVSGRVEDPEEGKELLGNFLLRAVIWN